MQAWLDVLGVRCVVCRRFGPPICETCACELEPAARMSGPPAVSRAIAAFTYTGAARKLVLDLKLKHLRPMGAPLAAGMLSAIWREGLTGQVITWVPGRSRDILDRGFDHAKILARQVSARTGLPLQRLVVRSGQRPDQTTLGRQERLENPRGAFAAVPAAAGLRVALVDDLITTGATAGACAEALLAMGALSVEVIVACRA